MNESPPPRAPVRILFVCLGNICRSPSAENLLRHRVASLGHSGDFTIDSAGTAGYHVGKSADSRMTAALRNRGVEMNGLARQVRPSDFADFDWILAMDRSNLADLEALRNRCESPRAKLALFCDFCESHDEGEVPDPYYGGAEGFEKVLDLLEDGCGVLIKRWRRGEL